MSDATICAPQVFLRSRSSTDLHSILFQALPQSIMRSSLPILLICMKSAGQSIRYDWWVTTKHPLHLQAAPQQLHSPLVQACACPRPCESEPDACTLADAGVLTGPGPNAAARQPCNVAAWPHTSIVGNGCSLMQHLRMDIFTVDSTYAARSIVRLLL